MVKSVCFGKAIVLNTLESLSALIAYTLFQRFVNVSELTVSVRKYAAQILDMSSLQPGCVGVTIARTRNHYKHLLDQNAPFPATCKLKRATSSAEEPTVADL